ncbi:hypothetical protein E2C01_058624 [Portunus trituberculatus]|uniref:Uncharacterized protein n=1 Tax=Portunus trituberculatus TaxID=210409 RepID=A0A5B7H580_PORTR|nr:hypothetical protein [Portunus trituberculatus]
MKVTPSPHTLPTRPTRLHCFEWSMYGSPSQASSSSRTPHFSARGHTSLSSFLSCLQADPSPLSR